MSPEEYRKRVLAIETQANDRVEACIAAFPVHVGSRSVRYRDMARAIASKAVEPRVNQIRAEMTEALEALETEWWSQQEDD